MLNTRLLPRLIMAAMIPLIVCTNICAQIDDNTNSLGDVWETAHSSGLLPDEDDDGDGFKNREEAAAGTHPLNSQSFPRVSGLAFVPPNGLSTGWPTVAGIRYQPMVSSDMRVWKPVGGAVIGTGEQHQQVLDASSVVSSGAIRRTRWAAPEWGLNPVKAYAVSSNPPAPLIDDTLTRLETLQSNPNLDNYGQWLRGWIIAPETGSYTFWIASDDSSELWLSPNKKHPEKPCVARWMAGPTPANGPNTLASNPRPCHSPPDKPITSKSSITKAAAAITSPWHGPAPAWRRARGKSSQATRSHHPAKRSAT